LQAIDQCSFDSIGFGEYGYTEFDTDTDTDADADADTDTDTDTDTRYLVSGIFKQYFFKNNAS